MKRSPIKKKRAKPRTYKTPRCTKRCTNAQEVGDLCRRHAKLEIDRLFSLFIRQRDKKCRRCGTDQRLQAAHVVSRSYKAIRWEPENCVTLCTACHMWQTHHPVEGEEMFDFMLGKGHVAQMKYRALNMPMPDLADTLYDLRIKVAA